MGLIKISQHGLSDKYDFLRYFWGLCCTTRFKALNKIRDFLLDIVRFYFKTSLNGLQSSSETITFSTPVTTFKVLAKSFK